MNSTAQEAGINLSRPTIADMAEDTYVNILMALEGAKVIGDATLIYLLKMSLEQLCSERTPSKGPMRRRR
ncbi:hypothetical protein SAMN04515647_3459 [Cohaesibacter sp. ES.047]|uniref:hypothetical protein n=1 Tax=Cohaesibacter sp. ES.047 TaxID=1798205 RepID=UPI000BB694B1|nr:hypothetical protein [Cohaesibacter sp. ES.047]SNY93171.1 hypothetical protein SAMN04515647_3459 [Cohaesibacter sp. ES.047]